LPGLASTSDEDQPRLGQCVLKPNQATWSTLTGRQGRTIETLRELPIVAAVRLPT
jgi:hypothetical protein